MTIDIAKLVTKPGLPVEVGDALLRHTLRRGLAGHAVLHGIECDFGGVRLENMRVLGTAFAPLTLNTCSPNSETCVLSFCVRRSHFRPETIERFASETGGLIVAGDDPAAPPAPPESGGGRTAAAMGVSGEREEGRSR